MPLENAFQKWLIEQIKVRLPTAIVMKLDSSYMQGIPDLLILNGPNWGVVEVKRSRTARRQPNQEYYIALLGEMSFAAVAYPENAQEVLDELQFALAA